MAKDKPEAEGHGEWGVFGGMFNPVHHGHLITARRTAEIKGLDRILLIPSSNPPHRNDPYQSADVRYDMTEKTVEDDPVFEVSDVEMNGDEPSYTYNTLETLEERHPRIEFSLIVGMDELRQFKEWYRWDDLLDNYTTLGLKRGGISAEGIDSTVMNRVEIIDVPLIEISSTEIRERVKDGRSIRYLVPVDVEVIIEDRQLYRD